MVAMHAKVKLINRSHDSVREEEIGLTGAHLVFCDSNYVYTLRHQAVKVYQLAVDRISFFSRGVRWCASCECWNLVVPALQLG
jgi:hypothetical protein